MGQSWKPRSICPRVTRYRREKSGSKYEGSNRESVVGDDGELRGITDVFEHYVSVDMIHRHRRCTRRRRCTRVTPTAQDTAPSCPAETLSFEEAGHQPRRPTEPVAASGSGHRLDRSCSYRESDFPALQNTDFDLCFSVNLPSSRSNRIAASEEHLPLTRQTKTSSG